VLLHVLDRKIVNRQVFFFQAFDLAGQLLVLIKKMTKLLVRGLQCLDGIEVLGKFMVKVVVLNVHDRGLLQIPARPMRDRTMGL
jgi:hypothetical protein